MHRSHGHASRAPFPVMVRTLRGLEAIARTEVETLLGPLPITVEHRALRFTLPCPHARLLALGTVDDVLSSPRWTVSTIGADPCARWPHSPGAVDAATAIAALDALRPLPRPITFDVTASFIGRRNYSRFEIEHCVGQAGAAATGWRYRPRSALYAPGPTSASIRVHMLHTSATLSVRLAERPLHRRRYRTASRPGALHPPLARALCLVADVGPGHLLVDPACGVGTVPIEAALLDSRVEALGFDLDPASVHAARANVRRAGVDARLRVADATRLPLAQHSVDRVVTNPPWGEPVAAAGGLRRRPHALWIELAASWAPPAGSWSCCPPMASTSVTRAPPASTLMLSRTCASPERWRSSSPRSPPDGLVSFPVRSGGGRRPRPRGRSGWTDRDR